jgi:hypothetical protein
MEAVDQAVGGMDRQRRLAHSRAAVDPADGGGAVRLGRVERSVQLRQLTLATGEGGNGRRQLCGRCGTAGAVVLAAALRAVGAGGVGQRGIAGEDRLLQPRQVRPRLDAEFLDQ